MKSTIKTKDSGEPLVLVKKYLPDIKFRLARNKEAYLRKTVVEMLVRAEKLLPKGMTFTLGDAWRPQEEQKRILANFYRRFKKTNPKWSNKRILQEVDKYVAPAEGRLLSGHLTGAAIDIRLYKNGRRIPMKSAKLTYQENAQSDQPKLPKYIQNNRKILFDTLTKVGFSNYPRECWHWSYGDWQWAKRAGKNEAFYGLAKLKNNQETK